MNVPIRPEAEGAVRKEFVGLLHELRERRLRGNGEGDPLEVSCKVSETIKSAISAFCETEGLRVETSGERPVGVMFPPKAYERLVSEWREVSDVSK